MAPFEKNPYRPFCSRACKGLDLIHWTEESYRIAKDEQDEDSSTTPDGGQ
ncbi:MAG TPA: DNA gyrase inhibitor YacG [Deltaproteobacteria bacterium]|nr:DNA gyrase inhibitor YacG [Deltaproteobacteria bacterium]HOI08107.1 DNA gyrase inhibitor YacG [Deltaproteobacteria bacterium]